MRLIRRKYRKNIWVALLVVVALLLIDYYTREEGRFSSGLVDSLSDSALQKSPAAPAASAAIADAPLAGVAAMELPQLQVKRREQRIEHLGYTVSYNADWHLPNWVAYQLDPEETTGVQERSNKFLPDPLVNGDPVVTKDYSNSGYDRGHMAPAADMRWSEEAMRESFYMTNMCPQNHNNNAGDWKQLEELGRDLAAKYGTIYIACGPVPGGWIDTIGSVRRILVPRAFYKVLLRQKPNGDWTSIGFVMENKAQSKPLMTYMMTVNDIEKLTRIDFFSALPDDVEEQVEADYTVSDWNVK